MAHAAHADAIGSGLLAGANVVGLSGERMASLYVIRKDGTHLHAQSPPSTRRAPGCTTGHSPG